MGGPTFPANLGVTKNILEEFLNSNFIQSFLEGGVVFFAI